MSFIVYDIGLLVLFVIFVGLFLYLKRRNLKKEGLLFLYRTKWGIRLINYVGKKYRRTLTFFSYVGIGLGYILMAGILYLFGRLIWLYILHPNIVRAIKVPPIMPLIPYLPQVFKLDFLPPFYFIYWIIILAVIAITHEFAHGIFASHNQVKIKRTGFGFFPFFLPVFLAAFVELDEKVMVTKKKFSQMAILAAGTLANTLTAIFFFIIIGIFFSLAFTPAGVTFDTYSYSFVKVASVTMVNGICTNESGYYEVLEEIGEEDLLEIQVDDKTYFATKEFLKNQKKNQEQIVLYDDAPAINAGLKGAIKEINNVEITSLDKLSEELLKYSPGNKVSITTINKGEIKDNEVILGKNPQDENYAWLGVGFIDTGGGVVNRIFNFMSSFKKPHVYYESKIKAGEFIYNLLWWLILISISIALVNMLPVGIFDGGRFFYLTMLGITGSEIKAKKTFSFMTKLFLFLLVVLMFFWAKSFF